jgi:ankyrin repeat protein
MNKNIFSRKNMVISTVFSIALFSGYQYRYILLSKAGFQPLGLCYESMDIVSVNDYLNQGGANTMMELPGSEAKVFAYYPLLHCAIKFQHTEIIRSLLNHGADPNVYSFDEHTNIYSSYQHTQYVKNSKATSLHRAIIYLSNHEIIDLLLNQGANPNLSDQDGNTPVHYLAAQVLYSSEGKCFYEKDMNLHLFNLFVKYRADPYIENMDGDTALHLSARQGSTNAYDRMIALGWNPLQKNKKGEAAQQLMKSSQTSMLQCKK